ncbi:FtsB family cell division protein [Candidatus Epulonipiscium viviparus]|uniref:FtsB family cell division protein n=1 Tax=Candidatus Epulonipiscium viviparus TaxID=420336 RepID=UPI0027381275|nr:septum formation initiator family protein [Candidatus Epulopiscium viviparus]
MPNMQKIIILGTICIIGILAVQAYDINNTLKQTQIQLSHMKEDVAALEQNIKNLEHQKTLVGTNEYIEDIAREKLGLIKEGDIIFKER